MSVTVASSKRLTQLRSSDAEIDGNIAVGGTVDGVDIAARDAVLTSTTTTADAALPKSGGAMTGAITTNSTFDGIDVGVDVAANTAKIGITSGQASAITANTAKTGITTGQAEAITANTAKTSITAAQAQAIIDNTAKETNVVQTTVTGNAGTVTNGVYTTGDQTIAGTKTFTSNLKGTPANANTNSLTLGRTDNSNYWNVNHAGNDFRLYNTASSDSHILFGVDSSGTVKANNVGIGTATPGQKLDVVGNIAVSGTVDGIDIATDVAANTAKTGITSGQASAITANTAKTGITSGQASAITANTAKTGITSGQASAITANTAKTGITIDQASAITANTAKTGITSGQASAITANTTHAASTHAPSGATVNSTDATLKARANHTGTQTASTISDFDTEVANNSAVTANTAKTSNIVQTTITGNAGTVTNGVYTTSSVTALSDVTSVGSGAIITAAERTVVGNTTGTNSGDNAANTTYSNVTNESKATMFTSPTFTGNVTASSNISASGTITSLASTTGTLTVGSRIYTTIGVGIGNSVVLNSGGQLYTDEIDAGVWGATGAVVTAEGEVVAPTATIASTSTLVATTDNAEFFVTLVDGASGAQALETSTKLKQNPSTGKLTVTGDISASGTIVGSNLSGTNTGDQSTSDVLTLIEDGVDSVHYKDGSIDTIHIGDDQVTFAKALGVTPNVYGSTIKLIPSDFETSGDGGNTKFGTAFDKTAGATYGMRTSDSTQEVFAFVSIPEGMKATYVEIYGRREKAVEVFEVQINATTVVSKGTGTCTIPGGSSNVITLSGGGVSSTATNLLAIEVLTNSATADRIYGGTVTIAAI